MRNARALARNRSKDDFVESDARSIVEAVIYGGCVSWVAFDLKASLFDRRGAEPVELSRHQHTSIGTVADDARDNELLVQLGEAGAAGNPTPD
jgi:hypothetical protein